MSRWQKLKDLANSNHEVQKRLVKIYQDNKFSVNIRGILADRIESVDWLSSNTENMDAATIQMYFDNLLTGMETKISNHSHDFEKKMQLKQEKENLKVMFSGNLVNFIHIMQQCMKEELLLIESCDPQVDSRNPQEERAQENPVLNAKLQELHNALNQAENELTQFGEHQANFLIEYRTYSENIVQLRDKLNKVTNESDRQRTEKEVCQLETERSKKIQVNFDMHVSVGRNHEKLAYQLKEILKEVWSEIDSWKYQCKRSFAGFGNPKEGALDILDSVCLRVNGYLLQLLNQIDKVLSIFNNVKYKSPDEWIQKMKQISALMEQLLAQNLQKIFVVDLCPRIIKVVKSSSRVFSMSCRLLGGHALNLQRTPIVTAELHKEQDVVTALGKFGKKGICQILNGKGNLMDFNPRSKQYVVNFSSVQLQNVKQHDKSSDKLVMEYLFGMIFYTTLTIRERSYNLSCYAPAIALITHVNQDCMARAFLMWDAAFSKPDHERSPFEHPEEVPWKQVAKVLDALFKENTGRGLSPEQLNYLGKMAFQEKMTGDLGEQNISKSMLLKDKVIKNSKKMRKDFSFWIWFYANLNLVKDRLKEEWTDGLIHGFISKESTSAKLQDCEPGTFILRFSERSIENSSRADICGCLTLAVVEADPDNERNKIYYVKENLTSQNIYERGLGVILEAFEVKDYKKVIKRQLLRYLYPNHEFMKVFGKYIPQRDKDDDDEYLSGKLRIELFLTNSNVDPVFPRNNKITLPMFPIAAVPNPAACYNHMDVGSPISELDDSQHSFSQEGYPRAVAMVQPNSATSSITMVQPTASIAMVQPNMATSSIAMVQPNMTTSSIVMVQPNMTTASTVMVQPNMATSFAMVQPNMATSSIAMVQPNMTTSFITMVQPNMVTSIAMEQPNMATSSTVTTNPFQNLSMNPSDNSYFATNQQGQPYDLDMMNSLDVLPDEGLFGDAADNLFNMDNTDLNGGGSSRVLMDENGDIELPDDFFRIMNQR